MIYKVGLLGASGRMGLEIAGLLQESMSGDIDLGGDRLELADAVTGTDKLRSIEGVETRRLSDPPREPVHVWIDYSRPEATLKLLEETKEPVLIATTGFTNDQLARIRNAAETRPIILSANTSPAVNQLFSLLNTWPGKAGWIKQVVLSEEHHTGKKDKPSGTAKTLGEKLKGQGLDFGDIHAVRAGGIRGNHTIRFIGEFEEVELTHRAFDRRTFALGALQGALFLIRQKKKGAGLFSMEDAMSEKNREKNG